MTCAKFIVYEKKLPFTKELDSEGGYIHKRDDILIYRIIGSDAGDRYVYKFKSYNTFESTKTKIPDEYDVAEYTVAFKKSRCGTKTLIKKGKIAHKNTKMYRIHDNGGRPFVVYISKARKPQVYIYKMPPNTYFPPNITGRSQLNKHYYTSRIKKYKADKVFIGKSVKNKMTCYSGGYGTKFNGNTILLQIGKKYVYIGGVIMEFTPDKINKYYSSVGNNDVPYPVALSDVHVYFIIENTYFPRSVFSRNIDWSDAYEELYEKDETWIKKNSKRIKSKIIQKRV